MRTQMFTPKRGDRPLAPNIAIVITDGASNVDPQLTIPSAIDAKAANITMIALGIGAGVVESELKGIASFPSLVFNVMDFSALDTIQSGIINAASEKCLEVGE